ALFSAAEPPDADDEALLEIVAAHRQEVQFVLVANKIDLGRNGELLGRLEATGLPVVTISALRALGLEELKRTIKELVVGDAGLESEEIVVTSARHRDALRRALDALEGGLRAIAQGAPEEIVAVDLRYALDALGEITGETTSEDVLNHIFANFCIGK
ncbi:MAG: tRNA uridine-5-carboxymethylaminomethyl(34) synthesis GTPase MnmE, partial [Calditrichaeota bacterium]